MAKRDPKLPVDPLARTRKGLTGEHERLSPTQAFAKRLREVRKQRDWTREQLVERLKTIGCEKPLTASVLAKIEGAANPGSKADKRKWVTIDEVFCLALALGVSPSALLTPYDDAYVQIATKYRPHSGAILRGWLAGKWTLADEDTHFFSLQMPPEEVLRRKLVEDRPDQPDEEER